MYHTKLAPEEGRDMSGRWIKIRKTKASPIVDNNDFEF